MGSICNSDFNPVFFIGSDQGVIVIHYFAFDLSTHVTLKLKFVGRHMPH